ncbi:GDSL esterase/lipase 1-like isoform X2 [Corylus avellana]|uniref:GDSL esterase/lipase 1-like isoform X2 n=1 Tax=Corylus avellana TaxID=13451 RepID=UPI00286B81EE|nr:GDSL esterase/lipase 1-like isoform X2 [Corylus avellana]
MAPKAQNSMISYHSIRYQKPETSKLEMASLNRVSLFCMVVALLIPFPSTNYCVAKLEEKKKHAALFIFGDSLFDAGNNVFINGPTADFWPYGETFFKHPTGRCCDGRLVPDFIAEYAKLELIKPYLQPGFEDYTDGVNFASAGAGVLPETHPGTINLKLQLSYFEEVEKKLKRQLGNAEAKKLVARAVYLFSIGGNDYMAVTLNQTTPLTSFYKKKYMTMVLANFTTVIKMGGRKFGFQNLGPIGCMPATKASLGITTDCAHEPLVIAKMHNIALPKLLQKIQRQLPGFKYALYDYYTTLAERTLYSTKFGFKVGKSACCGSGAYNGELTCGGKNGTVKYKLCSNPSEYVWFDAAHPTQSANRQLSKLFWSGFPNITGPYNLKKLFHMV